jgi:hypothetical protein
MINPTTRNKAHKALAIIKEYSSALLATRPNLYKQCLDGVATFETLRPRVTTSEPGTYCSLAGQQFAERIATASIDNVLAVLIEETQDHKWSWDVVTDIPLAFGSPVNAPCETREQAENAVIAALGQFGQQAKPAEDYEPVPDPDIKLQIRVNDETYVVHEWPEEMVCQSLHLGMHMHSLTEDALLASFAQMLLRENYPSNIKDEAKGVALSLLANCGWTHVTQQVLDDFCAANGIDMGELA